MPLLGQLEFPFRTVAGIADPGRFGAPQDAGVTAPGYNNAKPNLNLEETARELLCANGAARIAGARICASGSLPNRPCNSLHPSTHPGTLIVSGPTLGMTLTLCRSNSASVRPIGLRPLALSP